MAGSLSRRKENSDFKPRGRKPRKKKPSPPVWRLTAGPITQPREKQLITESRDPLKTSYTNSSQTTCQTPNDDFIKWGNGSITDASQSNEARAQRRPLASPKRSVRIGCCNVRTMFGVGKIAQVVNEARRFVYQRLANVDGQALED